MPRTPNLSMLGGWALDVQAWAWVVAHCPDGGRVLELGHGVGSYQFGLAGIEIHTIEHSMHWLTTCADILGTENIGVRHVPLAQNGWYNRGDLINAMPPTYDVLIIDGPDSANRDKMLDHLDLFNVDIPILIDDSNHCPGLVNALTEGRSWEILPAQKQSIGIHAKGGIHHGRND